MKKKYVLLTLFVFVFLLTNIFDGVGFCLPIIPGGKGFGMYTPAGSGRHLDTPNTTVYKVTNLNDSGPGSLRFGLEHGLSPKTIVFEVSGTINLENKIVIGGPLGTEAASKGSYITIAGQTAPSPGITIKDYGIVIERNCHDILIQHIRIRPGDTSIIAKGCPDCLKSSIADPLTLDDHYSVEHSWTPPYNIVVDHCSFSWGGDMNTQSGASDFTYSYNINSEALNHPSHPKGPHSKGMLAKTDSVDIAGSQNVFAVKNIFVHNTDRNPRIAGGDMVIANNLIYDVKFGPSTDDSSSKHGSILVSIVGNYIIETDTTTKAMYICGGEKQDSKIYIAGDNYYGGAVQTDPWNSESTTSFDQRQKYTLPTSDVPVANRATSAPIWPAGYTAMSSANARVHVLANAGARPADRDSVDIRIINQVKNETKPNGGIIASQDDVGGWPNLAQNTRALTVPSNPNEVQANGYTKLEEWLHEFSRTVEGKPGRPGIFTY